MSNFTWSPNTCQCKLVFDPEEKFVSCSQKCFLHKKVSDKKIWSTVLAHNHANNETKDKADAEYGRVRQLGEPVT
jgi:hypothetical protein